MKFADSVKQAASLTSTATITLGAAVTGFRTLAQAITDTAGKPEQVAVGDTIGMRIEDTADASKWEISLHTITGPAALTRQSIVSSSAAGAAVTFGGSVSVLCTVPAVHLVRLPEVRDIAFAQSVPLTQPGSSYMPQTTVAGALTFTPAAAAVRGALVYLRLVADGTNTPSFAAFKEWGGSQGYDNRNGIVNEVQFFYDGYDYWFTASQAVGATAAATAPAQMAAPVATAGVNSASIAFTAPANGGATITGYTVTASTGQTATGTASPISITMLSGTAATFTITATNSVGTSPASPASNSVTPTASATAPGAPTIGTATAGDASAGVAFTAPASNGGSAIIDYTVTSSPGNITATGTASPINVPGLTNGTAYTFTVKARNSVGSSAASAASSPAVTPAAAAAGTNVRLTGAKSADVTESAAAPWTYTSAGSATGTSGATSSISIPAAADAEIIWNVDTASGDFMVGVSTVAGVVAYSTTNVESLWANGNTGYKTFGTKTVTTAAVKATGDRIRFRKMNTAARADFLVDYDWSISRDGGQSWTVLVTNDVGTNGLRKLPYYFHVRPGANAVLSVLSQTGAA